MLLYQKLLNSRHNDKPSLIGLLDPDKKNDIKKIKSQLDYIRERDFCAIFIGGSLIMDSKYVEKVEYIKNNSDLPLISFPSSAAQINKNFDAVLFLSLVSGRNPQYLIGEQVISAPIVYDLQIEPIPVGYILLDGGGKTSVEMISDTRALPMDNHDLIISHALASQYLGHKFVYLECGSNARQSIELGLLQKLKKCIEVPIIVGGGIKSSDEILNIYNAGADFVVLGTAIEELMDLDKGN